MKRNLEKLFQKLAEINCEIKFGYHKDLHRNLDHYECRIIDEKNNIDVKGTNQPGYTGDENLFGAAVLDAYASYIKAFEQKSKDHNSKADEYSQFAKSLVNAQF